MTCAHTSDPVGRNPRRTAGVLLHPTSLPGRFGIGDLGDELTLFLDWAASAGMQLWQVLPLNPPGYGYSPYGCLSSVAGSPLLISPQRLLHDQLLTPEDVADVPEFPPDYVEFDRVIEWKNAIFRRAFATFQHAAHDELRTEYEAFVDNRGQKEWLDDFTLFMALKNRAGGAAWWTWDHALMARESGALRKARRSLAEEIRYQEFLQFIFFRQWQAVHEVAHSRGVRIMGDIPIYVAHDSADVWANREIFQLDDSGQPTVVAGVPPDYFSSTGQRWGNPLYRWDALRALNYSWWITRLEVNLRLADCLRLDHFRGFAAYWEVPAGEPTAVNGRWAKGPGLRLFDAIRNALGDLPLVAEDLGFITQEVHDLRHAADLPGMKILQFAFSQPDSPHLPHRFEPKTVVYTGTHDNDTARGWLESAPEQERENARLYLGDISHDIAGSLIRAAYTSVAETCIVPVQDILGLDSEARMNRPGDKHDNWSWRMLPDALTREHAERLRKLAELTGRA